MFTENLNRSIMAILFRKRGWGKMVQKLYYELPYVKSFQCMVISCRQGKKGYETVLDRTGFYPEGGGQPADTGTLNGIPVLDVQEQEGEIIHFLESPVESGGQAEGVIDWDRRFSYMQQHTGEHILSGLIHERFGYHNVGFHMGAEEVTIDFDGTMTMEEAEELELLANEVIFDNRPVRSCYPSEEELKTIPYRSKKELTGPVRIVEIPGADTCACCGTHVERTGEIGLIKITSMIHYKGGVRMTIVCGRQALYHFRDRQKQILKISNLLSAKAEEAAQAVEKQKEELQAAAYLNVSLYRQLFEAWALGYPESDGLTMLWKKGLSPVQLRELANLFCQEKKGGVVLACSEKEGRYQYALAGRLKDAKVLAGALNARLNGRGGGSSQMAQGTFFAAREEIEQVILEEMNGLK